MWLAILVMQSKMMTMAYGYYLIAYHLIFDSNRTLDSPHFSRLNWPAEIDSNNTVEMHPPNPYSSVNRALDASNNSISMIRFHRTIAWQTVMWTIETLDDMIYVTEWNYPRISFSLNMAAINAHKWANRQLFSAVRIALVNISNAFYTNRLE